MQAANVAFFLRRHGPDVLLSGTGFALLDTAQATSNVGRPAALGQLAVVDDVNAVFDLLAYNLLESCLSGKRTQFSTAFRRLLADAGTPGQEEEPD